MCTACIGGILWIIYSATSQETEKGQMADPNKVFEQRIAEKGQKAERQEVKDSLKPGRFAKHIPGRSKRHEVSVKRQASRKAAETKVATAAAAEAQIGREHELAIARASNPSNPSNPS